MSLNHGGRERQNNVKDRERRRQIESDLYTTVENKIKNGIGTYTYRVPSSSITDSLLPASYCSSMTAVLAGTVAE